MQVRARSIEQQRCTRIFICEWKKASSDCKGSKNWRDEHASPERILSCSQKKYWCKSASLISEDVPGHIVTHF